MNKTKKLAKNTLILFIGTFFTKVIQYFLLPIYTGYLSTTEYGTVELFNTIITLFVPIIGLQVEQGVFRFLIKNRDNQKESIKIISSSICFISIVILLTLLVFLIINPFIHNNYKWIILLNLYLSLISTLIMQIARGIGDNKNYSISNFITALISISFTLLFLIGIGLKINGVLYASAIGYLFGIIFLFIKLKIYKYFSLKNIDKNLLREILVYSLPMIPNSISWWIFSSSDRIIISLLVGVAETGLLSIAYKFSNIGIIIYNVFNMSLTESISLHINDKDIEEYFSKIFNSIGNIFTSFGAILISFMPFMFRILINENYNESYGLIPIAIAATIFQVYVGMFGTIYVAKNNTKSIAITSIIAAIVNILVDLIMVKYIGVYAAVISTFVSYFVLFIYRFKDINSKYIKIRFNNKLILNILICIFIICPIYYLNHNCFILLNIIISIICLIIFNNDIIKSALNILKRRR